MSGTVERPRLTIFRSNKRLFLQAVNDDTHTVIASMTDSGAQTAFTGTKTARAVQVAQALIKKLQKAKVTKLAFDRGSYKYHGRVKAVAETLRAGGIEV